MGPIILPFNAHRFALNMYFPELEIKVDILGMGIRLTVRLKQP